MGDSLSHTWNDTAHRRSSNLNLINCRAIDMRKWNPQSKLFSSLCSVAFTKRHEFISSPTHTLRGLPVWIQDQPTRKTGSLVKGTCFCSYNNKIFGGVRGRSWKLRIFILTNFTSLFYDCQKLNCDGVTCGWKMWNSHTSLNINVTFENHTTVKLVKLL